jgi:Flp pilus assembly protein TadG
MVIVMPALLLLVTVIFQGMEYYWARQAAETAARQAVDAARLVGAANGDGNTRANAVLNQLGSPLEAVNVTVATEGTMVVATVTGRPHQLVPFMAVPVRATAQAPVEQFSPP